MNTTYFIRYKVRKANGRLAMFQSQDFETWEGARVWYENKIKDEKVLEAFICQCDHYDQEELTPEEAYVYAYGKDCITLLVRYHRY